MRFPGSGGGVDDGVRGGRRRARGRLALVAAAVLLLFGGSTLVSWYVEALWFESMGFGQVFWTTITLKTTVFWVVGAVTFTVLFGAFRLLRPRRLPGQTLYVNGQAVTFSLEPIVTAASWVVSLLVAICERVEPDAALGDDRALPERARAGRGVCPVGPDLRTADPVLPAHAPGSPPGHQLADDRRPGGLPGGACRVRRVGGGRPASLRRGNRAARVPRHLVLACVPPAGARRARVSLPLRSAVRRPHHLLRRRLHRGPRGHPGADRRVGGPCARRPGRDLQRARTAAAGGSPRGARTCRGRLRRAHCRFLVRRRLRREAQPAGARTPLHHAQHRHDAAGLRPGANPGAGLPGRVRPRGG